MSDTVWLALIAAIPPTLAGLAAYWHARNASAGVAQTHTVINGRLDQLLETTRVAAHALGVIAGRKLEAEAREKKEQA